MKKLLLLVAIFGACLVAPSCGEGNDYSGPTGDAIDGEDPLSYTVWYHNENGYLIELHFSYLTGTYYESEYSDYYGEYSCYYMEDFTYTYSYPFITIYLEESEMTIIGEINEAGNTITFENGFTVIKEGSTDPGDDPSDGGTESGLYMGIIGFNESLNEYPIELLSYNSAYDFVNFVNYMNMKSATGLYYAVDNAINRLQSVTLPDDLESVSIVTFTDGLDNVSIDLNTNYATKNEYRDALRDRISTTKIKGLPISAYSIGVQGGDVTDIYEFKSSLAALASNSNNVKEVSSMNELNQTFADIANSLYDESRTQSISLKITSGYDDGTKIRFTFDNPDNAAYSEVYIEGIYRRNGTSRTLQNVVYHGLNSSSGISVNGILDGVYVTFTFENIASVAVDDVLLEIEFDNIQQWEYIGSQGQWQQNSEFSSDDNTEVIVSEKSAVIMLVLDCTTSLDANGANGSSIMKRAVNNFIETLSR